MTGISIPNQTVRACFAGTGLFIPDRESRIGRFTGHTAVVIPDGVGVGAGLTLTILKEGRIPRTGLTT